MKHFSDLWCNFRIQLVNKGETKFPLYAYQCRSKRDFFLSFWQTINVQALEFRLIEWKNICVNNSALFFAQKYKNLSVSFNFHSIRLPICFDKATMSFDYVRVVRYVASGHTWNAYSWITSKFLRFRVCSFIFRSMYACTSHRSHSHSILFMPKRLFA